MPKRPLPILLRERKEAAAKARELLARIETLDAEIVSRYEEVSGVLGLVLPEVPDKPIDVSPEAQGAATHQRVTIPLSSFLDINPGGSKPVVVGYGRAGQSKSSKYDEAVAGILAEANGGPLPTKVIYSRMLERGVTVDGKIPLNNLSAHLSHSDLFQRTAEGWALKQGELRTQ